MKMPPSFLTCWMIFENGTKSKGWWDAPNKCWWSDKSKGAWAGEKVAKAVVGWKEISTNSFKRQIEEAQGYHKAKNACNENKVFV